MPKYITKNAAINAVENAPIELFQSEWEEIEEAINTIPAADVAPVVYGRWGTGRFNLETGDYEEQCTHCRNFSTEYGKPYCPSCGAKMNLDNRILYPF